MHPRSDRRVDLSLNRANRLGLLVLLIGATAALAWALSDQHVKAWPDLPCHPARQELCSERIDPNTAAAPSLMRLAGLGPTRAQAIVQFRSQGEEKPFRVPADLTDVHGIGPGTVRGIQRWLALDEDDAP
ncbi:MAG: ComEA family DNA-binding protein [Phycisphaerae bacterium]